MSSIVVIGAGVGGLAVAARLAANGHRVSVFERSGTVGGKLGQYVRETPVGTFRFDTGPSLLTLPQVFDELFDATGGPADLDFVELDPIVRHVFADSTVDSCRDPQRFVERIGAAFGADAAEDWARLWRRAGRIWAASWRDILRRPVDSPLALAGLAWRLGDLRAIAPGRTLRGVGRTHLRDPRLRMLLDRYATYAGADPRRAPAALLAIPYAEMAYGGWYLRGGLRTLADALLRRCLDLGVRVHTGAAVTAIDAAGGRVHGIRVNGTRVKADIVVSNVDALTLYRDLLPTPQRLATLADRSLAGYVLLLGVRGHTPGLAHHTVFFPAGPEAYDREFDAVFGGRPAADPAVFVSAPGDPSSCPPGHEAWFVLVNAARHGRQMSSVDWDRPQGYPERILAVLAERGLEVRDRLVFMESRTPADLERSAAAPGGAIYGTAWHRLLRPGNRGPVRGLYLVGGSTHPGGGLPLVTLSATIVAKMLESAT